MTRTPPTTLAVAADYADAMLIARRAKNVLFWIILACLLVQLAIFLVARYVSGIQIRPQGSGPGLGAALLEFLVDWTDYLGVVLPIVLAVILFLIVTIMLVGRLIGVSQVTAAFCLAVALMAFLFPWQAILNSGVVRASAEVYSANPPTTAPSAVVQTVPDVRIPGALYTWPELVHDYDFPGPQTSDDVQSHPGAVRVLKWCRFVVYPAVMIAILVLVQNWSRRGLQYALGEAEVPEPPGT